MRSMLHVGQKIAIGTCSIINRDPCSGVPSQAIPYENSSASLSTPEKAPSLQMYGFDVNVPLFLCVFEDAINHAERYGKFVHGTSTGLFHTSVLNKFLATARRTSSRGRECRQCRFSSRPYLGGPPRFLQ